MYCIQEIHFRYRYIYVIVKGKKMMYHENSKHRKVKVTTLISDRITFKIENVTRDKVGLF